MHTTDLLGLGAPATRRVRVYKHARRRGEAIAPLSPAPLPAAAEPASGLGVAAPRGFRSRAVREARAGSAPGTRPGRRGLRGQAARVAEPGRCACIPREVDPQRDSSYREGITSSPAPCSQVGVPRRAAQPERGLTRRSASGRAAATGAADPRRDVAVPGHGEGRSALCGVHAHELTSRRAPTVLRRRWPWML
jgi:hypothetical protein